MEGDELSRLNNGDKRRREEKGEVNLAAKLGVRLRGDALKKKQEAMEEKLRMERENQELEALIQEQHQET